MELDFRPPRMRNIRQSAEAFFDSNISELRLLNQGYYSYVFYIELEKKPFKLIAKVLKKDGILENESMQLDFIKKNTNVKVPNVYGVSFSEQNGFFDILYEEYIDGVSAAGYVFKNDKKRELFCDEVVKNLFLLHSVTNYRGFGELNSMHFERSWKAYYCNVIQNTYAVLLNKDSEFVEKNSDLLTNLMKRLDFFIDCEPKKSTFVHGDYNLWNILISPGDETFAGIIDPLDCGFADPDIDLMQLLSVDREQYDFLDIYARNGGTFTDGFEKKIMYYRFWDNLKHLAVTGRYNEKLFSDLSAKLNEIK